SWRCLNYYKSKVWNTCRQWGGEALDGRDIADQPIAAANTGDVQQQAKYSISTSKWHSDKDLMQYVQAKDAAMVVVSSLSDADQVAQLVDQYGSQISFVFVQLTNS